MYKRQEAEFDFIRRLGGIAVFNHPFWEAEPKKGKYTHMESRMLDLIAGRKKLCIRARIVG